EQCGGCYNSRVPHVLRASAVWFGHSLSDGNRDKVTQVHPELVESRSAHPKWPGSSGGRAQP
ncbi:MAG TPA: hypothetical protein VFA40_04625, partial [Terriglobales bacterium]|nr:hypothetical protein [Terriglobales bacterium]